jgi:tRNA G18 (ribose-2'-O)-methylase SpoU
MPTQLTHTEITNPKTNKEIIVVADEIRSPSNVGMIFRVSEAFGCKKVILLGNSPNLDNRKVIRTARSAGKNLEVVIDQDALEIINKLKSEKFHLIGLEITDVSLSLKKYDFKDLTKIAVFIGNERNGINSPILREMDAILHFELFGKNSSINVVNALSIALYEVTR